MSLIRSLSAETRFFYATAVGPACKGGQRQESGVRCRIHKAQLQMQVVLPQGCKWLQNKNMLFDIKQNLPLTVQELFTGSKYKFKNEADSYQLIIMNPKVEDTGKYTIDINGTQSTAFLNVEEADPVYAFTKQLKKKYEGFTEHELTLECTVSSNMAIVSWWRGDKRLEQGDQFLIGKELSGICKLQIKNCVFEDEGTYSCRIEKQSDKTETSVKIVG